MCEESSTYGAQFKRMCIAVILCIFITMHCGSSLVLSPSFYRFHEKWPYQEKNCHPQKERKICLIRMFL